MPIYEYRCNACGHLFEVIQKFADAPLDTCPKCQGVLQKLVSSPAIQFKGSGWYITDYARKDGANAAKREGEDGGKPAQSTSSGDSGTTPASSPASSSTSKTTDAGSSR
jgi:putative FmdB family regulatory protein